MKRIPIYSAAGLAWDGNHFWIYDPYNQELIKFTFD